MKNKNMPLILAVIISDICGEDKVAHVKNSGSKKQCVPKPAFCLNFAKEDFSFATATASRTKTAWDTAKENKDIIPLYLIEEFAAANTEEKKFEGRHQDYITDKAVKGTTYNHIISDCSYEVLKSLKDAGYTRLFITLSDGNFTAEAQEDGTIKGEPIASYEVGVLNDSEIGGKPQNADITVKFKDHVKSVLAPDFDLKEYEGIYDVDLIQVSATSTEIKLKVIAHCGGITVKTLESDDFVVADASGSVQSVTFTVPDTDGVYTLTGTDFATGFTVSLDGVVVQTEVMYESHEPLTIEV